MKMKWWWLAAVVPAVAHAQQPAPAGYVPFTVQESDLQTLRRSLDDVPAKYALPIIQWLEQMENRARNAAAFNNPTVIPATPEQRAAAEAIRGRAQTDMQSRIEGMKQKDAKPADDGH